MHSSFISLLGKNRLSELTRIVPVNIDSTVRNDRVNSDDFSKSCTSSIILRITEGWSLLEEEES